MYGILRCKEEKTKYPAQSKKVKKNRYQTDIEFSTVNIQTKFLIQIKKTMY